ncbi:hypothetical protein GSI_02861 [Ganoderma sinense ZZ0214-1]|uniref:Thioesterase domain-containing protein n=1 Tax=Ganoderma sinense ZZ0214-1 TaxID=1077348 RepID=A0A2G8SMX3_9APHY|nr:hypothetical protein GSI_02861 [Ganoderma sinense ZZ0214-1]
MEPNMTGLQDVLWTGDISEDLKDRIARDPDVSGFAEPFAYSVGSRTRLKEVALYTRDGDGKTQCKLTYVTTVQEDMINMNRTMHGGCAVYLIDTCSGAALIVLAMATGKPTNSVSQALNTTFHAPAPYGVELEIVNRTTSLGARVVSAVTEIWDVTNGRLCVTGAHHKMAPSQPKL